MVVNEFNILENGPTNYPIKIVSYNETYNPTIKYALWTRTDLDFGPEINVYDGLSLDNLKEINKKLGQYIKEIDNES